MNSSASSYNVRKAVHACITAETFMNIVSIEEQTGNLSTSNVANHVSLDLDDNIDVRVADSLVKDAAKALSMCKEIEAHPDCAKPGSGCIVCEIVVKSILSSDTHVFNYCKNRVGHLVGDAWEEGERAKSEAVKWINEELPILDFFKIIKLHKKSTLCEATVRPFVPEGDAEFALAYLANQIHPMLKKIDQVRQARKEGNDSRANNLCRQLYVCGRLWRAYMYYIETSLVTDNFRERYENSEEYNETQGKNH